MKKYCLKPLLSILCGFVLISGCSKKSAPSTKPGMGGMAVPVTVAPAVQKDVPYNLQTFGAVESVASVAVKSQVGGVLTNVHFKEGDEVRQGQLLCTIDARPYQTAVRQAESEVARQTVQYQNARKEADRQQELMQKGLAAEGDYDQAKTAADAFQASMMAAQAALENARLQLDYCFIHSPINGRAGSLQIDPGNLIKANDVTIVSVNQTKPIYVSFTVPQQELERIVRGMASHSLPVRAVIPQEENQPETGEVVFVDNQVDAATGTVRLKGLFNNESERLWPGQFVRVFLTVGVQTNAVVVPSRSIQRGQSGAYVFVAKPDQTVEYREIKAGRSEQEETIVEKGILPGEVVVTDGQSRLGPGAKYEVKTNVERAVSSP
jgi:multidrug efflux system membrane fusion protein